MNNKKCIIFYLMSKWWNNLIKELPIIFKLVLIISPITMIIYGILIFGTWLSLELFGDTETLGIVIGLIVIVGWLSYGIYLSILEDIMEAKRECND